MSSSTLLPFDPGSPSPSFPFHFIAFYCPSASPSRLPGFSLAQFGADSLPISFTFSSPSLDGSWPNPATLTLSASAGEAGPASQDLGEVPQGGCEGGCVAFYLKLSKAVSPVCPLTPAGGNGFGGEWVIYSQTPEHGFLDHLV